MIERRISPPARYASLVALFLLAPPWAAAALNPWQLLEDVRTDLQAAGPQTTEFVQTYVPAGFSSGDRESGVLSIWLPDCLRWSYLEPHEKVFLLCEGEVYAWNPGEPGGRHYRVEAEREPGLDLLLVDIAKLRERYVAEGRELEGGGYEITLATPSSRENDFRATVRVGPALNRVRALEYTDDEGNLTRFELGEYERLAHTALFRAPSGIEWTEE